MTGTFVPVDLDQVLDEFEEQEMKNGSPPKTNVNTKQIDSLDVPQGIIHPHMRFPSVDEPRTYSFNGPIDAILENHSNNIAKSSGTSLAQELAGYDFGSHLHDDDHDGHEDRPDDHNGVHDGDAITHSNLDQNDSNISGTASETSSTSDVIAAAEKITSENDFTLQKSNTYPVHESDSKPFSLETNDLSEGIPSSTTSTLPSSSQVNSSSSSESITEQNKKLEEEPDFLSILNSVVEEKSMCGQGSKSQTASFSSYDGSTSSSTELNEIKDKLVDKTQDLACATEDIGDSRLNDISNEQGEKCSALELDSTDLDSTDDSKQSSSKYLVGGDSEGDIVQPSEEKTLIIEDNFHRSKETSPSGKALEADDLTGVVLSENISLSDDVDNTHPSGDKVKVRGESSMENFDIPSCSTSRLSTDNTVADENLFFNATNNEGSTSEKCIECWGKKSSVHNEESEEGDGELVHSDQPNQQDGDISLLDLKEETSLVNPMISSDSVAIDNGLPQEGRPEEIVQNDPNLLVNLTHQETESLANRMSPIDSGSADSLCGTQDEDLVGMGNEPTGVIHTGEQSKTDLDFKMSAVHISSGDPEMGFVPPIWVPDDVATHCMNCGLKFSVIKRKHHCRACGKVLCSSCCNMKFPLPYMGNKDVRVCQVCCDILVRGNHQTLSSENLQTSAPAIPKSDEINEVAPGPECDDGSVYAAEVPPPTPAEGEDLDEDQLLDQALGGSGGEEEHEDQGDTENNLDTHSPEVSTLSLPSDPDTLPINERGSSASLTSAPLSPTLSDDSDISFRLDIEHVRALIPQESSALPPVLNLHKNTIAIKEHPDPAEIMYRLKGKGETIIFLLNKNLIVKVKIVKLRCCVKKKCWCFVTDGMGAASQEEMVILLECQHNENTVPKDVLSHFNTAFSYAKQGHVVSDLGFTIFGQPFLGSSDNAGFLYIKPSFQCLENLPLPSVPYVVGILIQRQEAPWAQLFPLRLMLRLGTEFRYYPCPLWSVRNRPSVYGDIGHTIMNLLTDFKNFQYSIPRITGLIIHMEDTKTKVRLPQDRYDEIVKVLNAAEEHMFAFGANFSSEADSHLVCIQEGETYKTQAINIQNKTRKVTGASFIVFTGSLKTSNPNDAKVSIIEDGLMIQMLPDAILELRKALREMQDYVIQTGSNTAHSTVNQVTVEWATRDANQQAYTSPIDGRSLTNLPSIQVHSSCDFTKLEIYRIRWTNVFLERNGERGSRGLSSRGLSHLTAELARACCEALRPHLVGLFQLDLKQLSLRVNIDSDSVEYSIGANEEPLPANLMADLDSALVPAINTAAMKHRRGPLAVELFFSIISLF